MPTYNRATYIGEAIESIQRQTYSNWELIIVDDGSTDNTSEIVSQAKDDRIHFHEAGRIAINGKIKNIGLLQAKGDLIAFMDSDDLWAETKLEKQVAALRKYRDAGFSLTGGYNFRNPHQPVDFFYKQTEGTYYGDILILFFESKISATTPSLIFKRECLDVIGSFDEAKPFSDIDFILKLARNFKAVILYECLLYRRLHETNDSGANWIKGYQQGIRMIHSYKSDLPSTVYHNALFKLHINFGEDCISRGEWRRGVKIFSYAWKSKPFSIVPLKKTGKLLFRWLLDPKNANKISRKSDAKPWKGERLPGRILAIRLQATGDVVISLPYLQYLRHSLPNSTSIEFLTRRECADIPGNIFLFDKVIRIGGRRNLRKQLLNTIVQLPKLFWRRYDIVIDLQNNEVSQMVRKIIRPAAWSVFDRLSSTPAGERTRLCIEAIGLGKNAIDPNFQLKRNPALSILKKNGWDERTDIVVLNPAGVFPTRNWPLENFISFAHLWLKQFPATQFLLLGTSFLRPRAEYLKEQLGERLIYVIDQTTPSEAFAVVQYAKFVLSEDSGLMHMAWISGIPTLALFGSTRSDWSRPLGKHTSFLDSSDLPCGNCMQERCAFGDNHCLTRYTPEVVFEKAIRLLGTVARKVHT